MKVTVIGAGASGMVAAITAKKNGHTVTLLEHNERVGQKILSTGNGRCNLSNELLRDHPEEYYQTSDSDKLGRIFGKFSYDDTIGFFKSIGLSVKSRNGLIYPYSDQAGSVLDVLRFSLERLGIETVTSCGIKKAYNDGEFKVITDKGLYTSDRLIIATGSKARPKTGSDGSGYDLAKSFGHRIDPVVPGLVQIRCKEDFLKSVSGVRIRSLVRLLDDLGGKVRTVTENVGELQFTDYGVSGIVVMDVSNHLVDCKGSAKICIDLLHGISKDDLLSNLKERCTIFERSGDILTGLLPKKLSVLVLKMAGIGFDRVSSGIVDKELEDLSGLIKGFTLNVKGTNSFDDAQICLGGVSFDEINDDLESTIVPGLYFAGEILNVHGPCGGFNLQFAWTSGAVCGLSV